eukprot:CAMPEP_0175084202 /NCGR_PEP_ID=MMETSP0052_2-20121109/27905_1 /TAXON_ID=51329 ORGANISM="Polytomella parva, Strain SAG 63-3" /NCGR_SAMPLE_ID=MMETSP0052_2 /ASSEMBLY_ACC=CAM_ASM_000194 /LENGTH=238 /DNA_ID=CAMNT_0016355933 /DNA_START=13 /DNA_END=730 /DNA_ORIENTATION=-
MGAFMSTLWQVWFGGRDYKVVMVGLDNAGKTTILYKLSLGEVVSSTATIGSNVELVRLKNVQLEIWDLGGQESLRPFWTTYYKNTDAIILVVDSTDRARIRIAKAELQILLGNEQLVKTPILIFANKQDLPDAMTPAEIAESLSLNDAAAMMAAGGRDREWQLQPCCALDGTGLVEGITWVVQRTQPRDGPLAAAIAAAGGGGLQGTLLGGGGAEGHAEPKSLDAATGEGTPKGPGGT